MIDTNPMDKSVDPAEIAHFSAMAETWWDPKGPFRPLHVLNPARLSYIVDQICARFSLDRTARCPLKGVALLDIGCGGGLLAEPMTRLGADVTAIDASEKNIGIARAHATTSGLAVNYKTTTAEALAATGNRFDVILNMEVIEHVADVTSFLKAATTLLKPGGVMVLSTLNRTPKSFMLAIVGAEYLLRWLPRGTHDWRKFLHPDELAAHLHRAGLAAGDTVGLKYHPLTERWTIEPDDLSVNYMVIAHHAAKA